jgi:hypothetical protein
MRTTPSAPRATRTLLLALALCACGGGGDDGGSGRAADSAQPGTRTAAVQTTAEGGCTTPPPTYPVTLLNGDPWGDLLQALADSGVTFPDTTGNSDTLAVKLCPRCAEVRMAIRSSNRTPCLSRGDLAGSEPRIVGKYLLLENFAGAPGWAPIPKDSSIFAFAQSPSGPAIMVYEYQGKTTGAPATAWQFWFCPHGGSTDKAPLARWRSRFDSSHVPAPRPRRNDEGEDPGGNYGWMTCASGCCQFYTPPPNPIIEFPDDAAGNSGSTGVGTLAGGPTWCRS